MGRAIRTQDGAAIADCIREIGEHGVFTGCVNPDERLDAAAVRYLGYAREGIKAL
jgi:copper homeostasis protein CutC